VSTREVSELERAFGHRFKDRTLLERALTHSSLGAESGTVDNETLEFLGDAVLDLAISELLMRGHPGKREGDLSRMRASLVNTSVLAERARTIELPSWLRLGKGEEKSGGRSKERILASAYEALLGAAFLDAGYETARECVARHFQAALANAPAAAVDYKTELQELTQLRFRSAPAYRVLAVSGPDHARRYEVEVLVDDKVRAAGNGTSRKSAEQMAARLALAQLASARVTREQP
jgi:ribonuclease-3